MEGHPQWPTRYCRRNNPGVRQAPRAPAAIFFTFEGNKIKESRHYFDSLTLLKQIGAQPK